MKLATLTSLILLVMAAQARGGQASADATVLRRFALVSSSNDGGPSRARLRFANSDAESVGRVLASLGGVHESDLMLVRDTTREGLLSAFASLRERISAEQRPRVRREIFVYFSGHSDEQGLLLGAERVSYRELRQWIDSVGADVRIAILDSCASGALIRLKGGVHRASFLSDVSTQARGHAFLTASSADEAAQESDRVGAAFFTHFLLSGMRGAADANHDRRVTLNEAYKFAYDETLQRTETSRAGAQHPAYDIQLAGTGDVVMTDLGASGARLVLARGLAGRIYVRDGADRLVAELRKEPTYPVELGLDAGLYHVVLDRDGSIAKGDFTLPAGGRIEIAATDLAPVAPMQSHRRGDEPPAPPAEAPPGVAPGVIAAATPPRRYRDVPFDFVLAPGYRMSGDTGEPVRHHFVLGLLSHSDLLHGAQVSVAGNIAQDGVRGAQVGGAVSLSYGPVSGVQVSGYNLAMGGLRGAQVGLAANVAKGRVKGVQVAMANLAHGEFTGAQIGLANVVGPAGKASGTQIGIANITTARIDAAADATGYGGASVGLVNVARKQRGVQVGLVNVADEIDGVQVGLVSVARKNSGVSVGLLPIVLDGENHATLSWDNTSVLSLGFKLGTRRVYMSGCVGITTDSELDGSRIYSASFGFGFHVIPRDRRLFLDIGARASSFASLSSPRQDKRLVSSLRLELGFAINRRLAVVAGPTLDVQTARDEDDRRPRYVSFAEQVWTSGRTTVRMYPGFVAGLEF